MKANINDSIVINFGKGIVSFRKSHNITQEKLAEKLDTDVRYLRDIEKGKIDVHYDTLVRFFSYFKKIDNNISFSKLLEGK